ncbi:MAG TPA: hypothetical protein VIC28_09020 [Thermoanaerobaculia bacterium]
MKTIIACVCSVVLWSAAVYSQTPAEGRIDLATILGQPAVSTAASGACATRSQSGVLFAAQRSRTGSRSGLQKNFCQASCGADSPESCSPLFAYSGDNPLPPPQRLRSAAGALFLLAGSTFAV